MVDRSDSILWQRMATEEMRREARRRGMKLSDLEEERALSVALQESATIGDSSTNRTSTTTTIPVLSTAQPTVAAINNNSTSSSLSIPPLTETVQTRSVGQNHEDDDALPDSDQLRTTTISPPPSSSSSSSTTMVDVAEITATAPLSIWQTSLPHEITNKVLVIRLTHP